MTRKLMVVLIVLLAGLIWSLPALAQGKFKIQNLKVTAYGQVIVAGPSGVQQVYRPTGKVLLAIQMELLPAWSETFKRLKISDKEISLVDGQGGSMAMTGYFYKYGMFKIGTHNLYAYRHYRWPKEVRPVSFNVAFAVPLGSRRYTLQMGQVRVPVTVPTARRASPDPAEVLKVRIARATLLNQVTVESRQRRRRPRTITRAFNPYGAVLELNLKITPLRGNGDSHGHFFWHTNWFQIATGAGALLPPFGEVFMGRLTNNVSHNYSSSSGNFGEKDATLYFAVPRDIRSFKLIYVSSLVAEGRVANRLGPPMQKQGAGTGEAPEPSSDNK